MNGLIYQQLQSQDWGTISKELLLHTIYRVRRYRWHSGGTEVLAAGAKPEDIVQQVIEKTLSGDRKWDPNRGALVPWLKDQVNSVVDALYHSAANKHEVRLIDDEKSEGVSEQAKKQTSHLLLTNVHATPENQLLSDEEALLTKHQVNHILDLVDDKSELQDILFAILEGCEPKPRFLADHLDIDVKEINNRLKRLRRLAIKKGDYGQS